MTPEPSSARLPDWQNLPPAEYEAAVFDATLDEITSDWLIGQPNAAGRMVAESPRIAGSPPDTEIVVIMWDDNVGTYERRYRIWRDDADAPVTAVPPPGTRTAPRALAMAIGDDLHS